MIYFIQVGTSGHIRIGCSIEPWKRIKQLQRRHLETLHLLKTLPGSHERKREIYKELFPYKIQSNCYEPESKVRAYIFNLLGEPEYEVREGHAYAVLRRDTTSSETDPCPFCGAKHIQEEVDELQPTQCSSLEAREKIRAGGITLWKSNGYIIRTRWTETEKVAGIDFWH